MEHPPVDPALAPLVELIPSLEFNAEVLTAVREGIGAMISPPGERPGLMTQELMIPGPTGAPGVRVVVTRPSSASTGPRPVMLWMHGGGYVIGRPELNQALIDDWVRALDCVVVAVAYRLAPETAHPGPIEDCYAALTWIHHQADTLGIDSSRVAVGGESAGAGLAAALSLLARDRGALPVCFELLVYPMIDDRTVTTHEPNPHSGQYVWTPEQNQFGWSALLGQAPGGDDVSPYAAAARADDLTGLPPTFIGVGALDLFVDEDLTYAHRLVRAGVPTQVEVYPGAFHGFLGFEGSWMCTQLRESALNALRRAFTVS